MNKLTELAVDVERRAAFDFGSGKVKMLVADIETSDGSIMKRVLHENRIVPLADDLMRHNSKWFSNVIVAQLNDTVAELTSLGRSAGATTFVGRATQAYRMADNGEEVLKQIAARHGVSAKVADQKEEAFLGLLSAAAGSNIPLEDAISWDFGGASFQISAMVDGEFMVYMDTIGKVGVRSSFWNLIRPEQEVRPSPNPVSYDEAMDFIEAFQSQLKPVPLWLKQKLNDPATRLIGIGAGHSTVARAIVESEYTPERLLDLIERASDCEDEVLNKTFGGSVPGFVVTDLSYLAAMFRHLGYEDTRVIALPPSEGLLPGILSYSEFWTAQ